MQRILHTHDKHCEACDQKNTKTNQTEPEPSAQDTAVSIGQKVTTAAEGWNSGDISSTMECGTSLGSSGQRLVAMIRVQHEPREEQDCSHETSATAPEWWTASIKARKAITDLSGIDLKMTPEEYYAVRSSLERALTYNRECCGWSERDCTVHLLHQLPRKLQLQASQGQLTTHILKLLDDCFLPATTDAGEEEWEAARIGTQSVAEFANYLRGAAVS